MVKRTFISSLLLSVLSTAGTKSAPQTFEVIEKEAAMLLESLQLDHRNYIRHLQQQERSKQEMRHRRRFFLSMQTMTEEKYHTLMQHNLLYLNQVANKSKKAKRRSKKRRKRR